MSHLSWSLIAMVRVILIHSPSKDRKWKWLAQKYSKINNWIQLITQLSNRSMQIAIYRLESNDPQGREKSKKTIAEKLIQQKDKTSNKNCSNKLQTKNLPLIGTFVLKVHHIYLCLRQITKNQTNSFQVVKYGPEPQALSILEWSLRKWWFRRTISRRWIWSVLNGTI